MKEILKGIEGETMTTLRNELAQLGLTLTKVNTTNIMTQYSVRRDGVEVYIFARAFDTDTVSDRALNIIMSEVRVAIR